VAKVGTSKAGSTISQIGCGTSVACHGKPIKEEEEEEEEEKKTSNLRYVTSQKSEGLAYTAAQASNNTHGHTVSQIFRS
jgi:hypothetical protein